MVQRMKDRQQPWMGQQWMRHVGHMHETGQHWVTVYRDVAGKGL
jgi:hypothetical protein